MRIEDGRTSIHATRDQFDAELRRAGVTLSPFPFEREFESFEEATDVILYRCIVGNFDPRRANLDWSLDPQHALEYTSGRQDAINTLLIAQVAKENLRQNTRFYSRRGSKIGLEESLDGRDIAKTVLFEEGALFDRKLLRCMRHVIRFGVDPNSTIDRGFSDEFDPSDLKFEAFLPEWQMGVSKATRSDLVIPVPERVIADYNERRGDLARIE